MSRRLRFLNFWLRHMVRPVMARQDMLSVRKTFERQARIFLRPIRGTRRGRTTVDGVPCATVRGPQASDPPPIMLFLHGGGYTFGSSQSYGGFASALSAELQLPAIVPDYRRAPENKYPAAFEDCMTVWDRLDTMYGADRIILAGDSAGGGLALALLGQLMAENRAGPALTIAFSPHTDFLFSGRSIRENAEREIVLPIARMDEMRTSYLGDADPANPRVTPLNARFRGANPVWLSVGAEEVLRDDTLRMAERLKADGVDVTVDVKPNHPHIWPIFFRQVPEAKRTLTEVRDWVATHFPPGSDS